MKKLLVLLTALCLSMSAILFGMGCNSTKKHDHVAATEWQTSETQHWHECTFDGCKEKLDLADHTYDQEVAKDEYKKSDATDTVPATYYKSCVCGVKGTETFTVGDAKGHTYPAEVEASAWTWTEAEKGYTATLTLNCVNGDDTKVLTATVVLSDDEDKTYPANCKREGLNTYVATAELNGNTYTAEKGVVLAVDPEAHNLKHFDLEAATCFKAGHKAYEYCASCKKYFEKDSENKLTETTLEALAIAKLEHDFENGTHHDAVASTCLVAGNVAYNECKNNCGTLAVKENDVWAEKTLEEVTLEKVDHNYNIDEDAFHCTVCGDQRTFVKGVPQIIIPAAEKGDFTMKFSVSMNVASVDQATWAFIAKVGVLQAENANWTIYGEGHIFASAGWNTHNGTAPYYFRSAKAPAVPECKSLTSEYTITRTGKFYTFYILTTYVNADGVTTVVPSLSAGSPSSDAESLVLAATTLRDVTPTISNYSFSNTAYDLLGEVTANDLGLDGTVVNVTEATDGTPSQESNYVGEAGLDLGYIPVGGKLELEFNNKRTTAGDNNWQNYVMYLYNADTNATLVGGSGTHNGAGNPTNALLRERGNNGETWKKGVHTHNGMFAANGIFCYNPGGANYNKPMENSTVSITIYRVSKDVVYTYTTLKGENLNMVGSSLLYLPEFVEGGVNKLGVALSSRGATLTIASAKLYVASNHTHAYGEEIAQVAATCVKTGVKAHYVCADCGLTFVKEGENYVYTSAQNLVIAKVAHNWGEWESVDATSHKRTCQNTEYCDATENAAHVKGDNDLCEVCGYDMSCKHATIELKAGKAATCTEDGFEAYYECADCHKLFSDEAGENVITAPVVIKALGHKYDDPSDPFKCTREGCNLTSITKERSEVVSILNEYKGDFTLTFDAVAAGNSIGQPYDHFGVYFVPKTEYELSLRNQDLVYCSATFSDYWWPAAAFGAGTEYRSQFQDIGFYKGKIVANVTVTRSHNVVYISVHQKGFDGNTVFNKGSVNTTEPEDGITQYITAMMDDTILSSIEVRVQGDEATFSNYKFTKGTQYTETSVITENVTIEKPETISNGSEFAEMPANKTQASFEQLLEVGQALTLQFTHKGAASNPGNNNWRNYFAYIYAANGENIHVSADNIIMRDRGNNLDSWTRADGTATYNHNWDSAGSKKAMTTLALNQNRPNDYDTQMQNCTVTMTIYRMSADKVAVSLLRKSDGMTMTTHFVVNLEAAYGAAVEKAGFALMTRNADITVTSAKLYTPVTEA